MLELTFSDQEMTAEEFLLVQNVETGKDIIQSYLGFIVLRAAEGANSEDATALTRLLLHKPFSEIARLFYQALTYAMPPTLCAWNETKKEFPHIFPPADAKPRPAAEDDLSIFNEDTVLDDRSHGQ